MGLISRLLGKSVQTKPTASKTTIPKGTKQIDISVQLDPRNKTDQITGAIFAASHVVGLNMPDFPKVVGTYNGSGRDKYQTGATVYNADNVEATVSLDEQSGLVRLTLQGNSMQHIDALTQKLAEAKLSQPDIKYRTD